MIIDAYDSYAPRYRTSEVCDDFSSSSFGRLIGIVQPQTTSD